MPGIAKEKWYKRFSNYKLSIILTFLAALGIAIAGIFFHVLPETITLGLSAESQWITDFAQAVYAFFFVSRMVSGIGYVVTPADIAFNEKNVFEALSSDEEKVCIKKRSWLQSLKASLKSLVSNIQKRPFEFIGLLIGFLAGLGISIASGLVGVKLSPLFVMKDIGVTFSYIASISTFSGLFSRLGRSFDFYKNRWADKLKSKWINQENVNYVLSVTAGIILGAVLAGVVGGLGLLPGGHFVAAIGLIGIVSTCASSSGYVGRLFDAGGIFHAFSGLKIADFFRNKCDKTENITNTQHIKLAKKSESRGTAIGVSVGVALGVVLIVAGVATLPFFGLGLPKLLAGIMIMGSCVSVSGGLGNRIGNAMDKKRQIKEAEVKETAAVSDVTPVSVPTPEPVPTPTPTPMPTCEPTASTLAGVTEKNYKSMFFVPGSVPTSVARLYPDLPPLGGNGATLWGGVPPKITTLYASKNPEDQDPSPPLSTFSNC